VAGAGAAENEAAVSAVVFPDHQRKLHFARGARLHLAVVLPHSVSVRLLQVVALFEQFFLLPKCEIVKFCFYERKLLIIPDYIHDVFLKI
jgi:hypothetical protein